MFIFNLLALGDWPYGTIFGAFGLISWVGMLSIFPNDGELIGDHKIWEKFFIVLVAGPLSCCIFYGVGLGSLENCADYNSLGDYYYSANVFSFFYLYMSWGIATGTLLLPMFAYLLCPIPKEKSRKYIALALREMLFILFCVPLAILITHIASDYSFHNFPWELVRKPFFGIHLAWGVIRMINKAYGKYELWEGLNSLLIHFIAIVIVQILMVIMVFHNFNTVEAASETQCSSPHATSERTQSDQASYDNSSYRIPVLLILPTGH